ncbi:M3 family metallopeptidase [Pseudomonas sp. W5-36]|uniref:M3 family metallopeptidase n=1 Tax=Pseudomonas sp. W5-36 TaxID=3097455 RepID=UPI00397A484D
MGSTVTNPLLQHHPLPPYAHIRAEHVQPAIEQILTENRAAIRAILEREKAAPSWQRLIVALDEVDARLQNAWRPVGHLNNVCSSPELRAAYEACLPSLSKYMSDIGQDKDLFDALVALSNSAESESFSQSQNMTISLKLRALRLSGIDLPESDQLRFKEISGRLSELASSFANNALDSTQGWSKHVIDPTLLAGLPESIKAQMARLAQTKDLQGWLVTLDQPAVQAVMTFADSEYLREEVYWAYNTRASDKGPQAGMHDNTPIIAEILALRHEMARLLGYPQYSDLSLATKMAPSSEEVLGFVDKLGASGKTSAYREYDELLNYAAINGAPDLKPWGVAYTSEKMRKDLLDLSQQVIRQYFPIEAVLVGLFEIAGRLFRIELRERFDFDRYHPDVRLFDVIEEGVLTGHVYMDLYARSGKRGGAWMDAVVDRRRNAQGEIELPIAQLACNFASASAEEPALLDHKDVITLFHELGHVLHHVLTRIDECAVSGINGVAWDAVELPSQFMENWCWNAEGLYLISRHHQTGESLPPELLEKMIAGRNFQVGMNTLRQVEIALFDFELHLSHGDGRSCQQVFESARQRVAVVPAPAYHRFPNTFNHVFAGGYAAGYYSYKWAEVLSADAFSRLEDVGGISAQVGREFRDTVLANGGSIPAMEVFKRFRGREPSLEALIKYSGLETAA